MHANEKVIWYRDFTKGIFHRRIVAKYIITDMLAVIFNAEQNSVVEEIYFTPSIVCHALGVHRESQSYGTGVWASQAGTGLFAGPRRSSSHAVGDLLFLEPKTEKDLVFHEISDPTALAQIVNALKHASLAGGAQKK